MIGADMDAARAIIDDLSGFGDFETLGTDIAPLCTSLVGTIVDPHFPGAVVPTINSNGNLQIFVAASTMSAWRRLRPVLQAFAGPTLTSFDGLPEALPRGDPVASVIARSQPVSTAVMHLPSNPRSQLAALRAVVRARDTLSRAPDLQRSVPEPTSWLLARFQDCLNVGGRDAAFDVLGRLKGEFRLDSLNLKFLEVQLLATFGDWVSITDLSGFANLCVARRPPAITALLLEALYRVYLADPFEVGDTDETRTQFETVVRPLAQPMLSVPPPPTITTAGWRLYGMEAITAPSRSDIRTVLIGHLDALGWIADRLAPLVPDEEVTPAIESAPLDDAREALVQVDAVDSVDALASLLSALSKLSPEELAQLREAEPFRSTLHLIDEVADAGLPASWIEWFEKVRDPSFTSALDVARHGKDEWAIGPSASDPSVVQSLVAALNETQNNDFATERTTQALPYLVAWLQRDPEFPRVGMVSVYSNVLTLFALGSARGSATYQSSQVLVSALLAVGLDAKSYRALIADIEELSGDGFGVEMVYWALEIVEDFMRASAPVAEERLSFLHGILSRIAPIYGRLTALQRSAVIRLASELGWTFQSFVTAAEPEKSEDLANRVKGLRIAIYSLTESSSRQAKETIEELAPGAVVDCNADHAGTARLRALAENADLFVVTWLSAKHAATDFIREHRAGRPLVYAQGRGSSSILRAVEDYIRIQSPEVSH
jgi:hypothetical protein